MSEKLGNEPAPAPESPDTPMNRQQMLDTYAAELDQKFRERYPLGQFVLQRQEQWRSRAIHYSMHWNPKRPTSHTRPYGISTRCVEGKIEQENHQNSSFGRCTYYKDLHKMEQAAKRLGFPDVLLDAFIERFNKEGFVP